MDLPIKNSTVHEIQLGIEPEGDCIGLLPGDKCVIRFLVAASDLSKMELDIEYRERFISIWGMVEKEVFVNGVRVR